MELILWFFILLSAERFYTTIGITIIITVYKDTLIFREARLSEDRTYVSEFSETMEPGTEWERYSITKYIQNQNTSLVWKAKNSKL